MRSRTLLVALAFAAAACDNDLDPTAPRVTTPWPATQAPSQGALTTYTSAFGHEVLPLLPNVQANQATAFGQAINEDGHVAGYIEGPFDGNWFTVSRATLWTPAGPQNLGTLAPGSPSQKSWATDVNDAGMVTGWGTTHSSTGVCCGVTRGFVWTANGGMQPLVPHITSDIAVTRGFSINAMGQVAGVVIDATGASHAALWTDPSVPPYIIGAVGTGAAAHDVNDVGQVVGVHSGGAFVWSAQDGATVLPTLGGTWTVANDINNLGVVVGFGELADGSLHPFRWTASGGMEDLGLPPGATHGYGRSITKSGRIAVTAEFHDAATGDVMSRLYLWVDGQWFDLGPAGVGSTYAGGINEQLQLAGSGIPELSSGMSAMRWHVTLTPVTPAFTFTGFFAPIQNLPVVNRAKAGQAIPVKFSLAGDQGLAIFAPGFPASQQVACDTSAPVDQVEATVTAGTSSLSYDAVNDTYSYIWKTETTWSGTCRSLTLRLTDGSEHTAHFSFTR